MTGYALRCCFNAYLSTGRRAKSSSPSSSTSKNSPQEAPGKQTWGSSSTSKRLQLESCSAPFFARAYFASSRMSRLRFIPPFRFAELCDRAAPRFDISRAGDPLRAEHLPAVVHPVAELERTGPHTCRGRWADGARSVRYSGFLGIPFSPPCPTPPSAVSR